MILTMLQCLHVQVVCAEATLASCLPVAKQAMKLLWEDTIATQGPSEKPGVDAVIARNLFKLIAGALPCEG